jgi:hypothetical protein
MRGFIKFMNVHRRSPPSGAPFTAPVTASTSAATALARREAKPREHPVTSRTHIGVIRTAGDQA